MLTTRLAASAVALGACLLVWPAHSETPSQSGGASQAGSVAPGPGAEHTAGRIERITVHGDALTGNLEGDSADREVSIYLPPSYDREPSRRYPVVYVLHGFTDSDTRWFSSSGPGLHFVNLPRAVDRADAQGAREMIFVMPNAFTKYWGSMYSNSVVTGDWEAFITQELVAFIDRHYRTLPGRASRGLAGHSMGGYGTLRLAMKFPGIFSSIYALSPCCLDANLSPSPALMARAAKAQTDAEIAKADFGTKAMLASAAAWSPDPRNPPRDFDLPIENGKPMPEVIAAWAANAPLSMVYQYIPSLKRYDAIAFDAGDRDVGIAHTVESLDRILTAFGVAHVEQIYSGSHIDHIEQRLETKVVPFFSEHLKFE
jgi:S-formylglutathione hydrolase